MQISVGNIDVNNPCTGSSAQYPQYEDVMFKIENNNPSTPVNVNTLTIVGWFSSDDTLGAWGGNNYRSMIYSAAGSLQAPTAGVTGTAAVSTSGSYHMVTFGFSTSGTIPSGGGYILAGTTAANPFWQLVNSTVGATVFDTGCDNYSGLESGASGSDGAGGTYYTAGTYYSNPHWMLYENGLPVCQYSSAGVPDLNSGVPATGATCSCPGVTPSATPSNTPVVTPSPTAVVGATLPYTEYEAEAGTYTGTLIGNSSSPATYEQTWSGATLSNSETVELAAEASGREAVQLNTTGQTIKWTTSAACNAIVVRYNVPAGSGSTTLSCIVSGPSVTTFTQKLSLTSAYQWFYGAWPTSSPITGYDTNSGDGAAFHLYDEMHALLGSGAPPATIPAGSTITLEKEAGDTNCVIDFIDLELVGAPISMPAGYTSITAAGYNADPTGVNDSAQDIQNCINAQTKVWIPAGTFYCSNTRNANFTVPAGTTIAGAGMWYSTLTSGTNNGSGYYLGFNVGTSNDVFNNFCIQGGCTNRYDANSNSGFYYEGGTGCSLTNIWVEHEKAGYWVGQNALGNNAAANGTTITGCRFRDLFADGVNMNDGAVNCTVTQCSLRYTGDDSIAFWSTNENSYAEQNGDSATYNTIQLPWRADGIAVYGGGAYNIADNYVADTLDAAGILVENGFTPIYPFQNTTTITGNTLNRCGGIWDGGISGGMEFWGNSGTLGTFNLTGNTVENSQYMGFLFYGTDGALGTFTTEQILNSGTYGLQVYSGTTGSVTFTNSTVSNSTLGPLLNSATGFTLTQGTGDTGF
jgi:hypothetical protein